MINGYSTGPARWQEQLRRCRENLARIEQKIAADPHSTRAEGWRARKAELERDIVSYEAALFAASPVELSKWVQ